MMASKDNFLFLFGQHGVATVDGRWSAACAFTSRAPVAVVVWLYEYERKSVCEVVAVVVLLVLCRLRFWAVL